MAELEKNKKFVKEIDSKATPRERSFTKFYKPYFRDSENRCPPHNDDTTKKLKNCFYVNPADPPKACRKLSHTHHSVFCKVKYCRFGVSFNQPKI